MSSLSMWALLSLAGVGYAQQPGTMKTEGNPTISVTKWALSQHFQYNLKSQSCQSLMIRDFQRKKQHRISSLLVFFFGILQDPKDGTIEDPTEVKECGQNGCSSKDHKLVLDANWRWIHTEDAQNCYTGNKCLDGGFKMFQVSLQ